MTLHVCAPASFTYRSVAWCPWCEARRHHVVTAFVWYGPEAECGGCGHRWSDYQRRRQTNKQRALNRHAFNDRWMAAGDRAGMQAWMREQLEVL